MGYSPKYNKDDITDKETEFCQNLISFLRVFGLTPKTSGPILAKAMFLIEEIDAEVSHENNETPCFLFKKEYLKLIEDKK